MDLRQFRYFLAIVEEGSISRAAERLGVAQPSLSQHVLRLEDELGSPLLVRSPRGVTPTESGRLLIAHARSILKSVEIALEDIRRQGRDPYGAVSFGLPSSISLVLSVPLVEAVQRRLPRVSLRVVEALSGHIQGWLEDGDLDLAILYNASGLKHLSMQRLLTEELHLISAPGRLPGRFDRQGLRAEPIPLVEAARLPLVLPSRNHGLRDFIERNARGHGVELGVKTEMDALTQIKTLVARGSVHSILSLSAVQEELAQGRLTAARIVDPELRRTLFLVRNPNAVVTRASVEIEHLALGLIRDLTASGRWQARVETEEAS